jgi:hypothetical protein
MLNECCYCHATNDDRESDSRGEEVMNKYDVLPRAGLNATKKEMLATRNLQLINITLTQMTDEYVN